MRREARGQAGRYLGAGLASVGLDVGLLVGLHEGAGVSVPLATTVAFGASLAVNFLLNRRFFARAGAFRSQALRYGALVIVNYLITVVVVSAAAHLGAPYVVAKLGVVAGSTVWNFLSYRSWVFVDRA